MDRVLWVSVLCLLSVSTLREIRDGSDLLAMLQASAPGYLRIYTNGKATVTLFSRKFECPAKNG